MDYCFLFRTHHLFGFSFVMTSWNWMPNEIQRTFSAFWTIVPTFWLFPPPSSFSILFLALTNSLQVNLLKPKGQVLFVLFGDCRSREAKNVQKCPRKNRLSSSLYRCCESSKWSNKFCSTTSDSTELGSLCGALLLPSAYLHQIGRNCTSLIHIWIILDFWIPSDLHCSYRQNREPKTQMLPIFLNPISQLVSKKCS